MYDPAQQHLPTLAESLGAISSAITCRLFGHLNDPAIDFCLWCGKDRDAQ